MEVGDYLARIGLDGRTLPDEDLERLTQIHRTHVTTVPFENLAIVGDPYGPYDGEEARLSPEDIYMRLVERGRGGLCYDHNALFAWALSELGFEPTIAGARTTTDRPGSRPHPDTHMSVLVRVDGTRVVADVGFGDIIRTPVPVDATPVTTVDGAWRVVPGGDDRLVMQRRAPDADVWDDRFELIDVSREIGYFADGFDFHYRDPDAPFGQAPFVSMATATGKKTLTEDSLTITAHGERTRRPIEPDAWHDVLAREFEIDLPSEAR